tara:strand:+ start:77 stop:505 length:429 start_codon:yes stop_codon:yes gene_type:complete
MEGFFKQRASDPRFQRGVVVPNYNSTAIGDWYLAPTASRADRADRTERYTFSAAGMYEDQKPDKGHASDKPEKKKKKRKSGEAFTEAEKKKLENRESSDDSDSGPCWVSIARLLCFACVLACSDDHVSRAVRLRACAKHESR